VGSVLSDKENSLYALALMALSYPLYRWITGTRTPAR